MRFREQVVVLFASALLISTTGLASSHAQDKVTSEFVVFRAATVFEPGAEVKGELRIPETGRNRVPAVLVLHSSNGIDSTGKSYIEMFNRVGIATLEIDMFPRGGRPQSTRFTMPHGYGGLIYLATHPRIEPQGIGVIGFSWGGTPTAIAHRNSSTASATRARPVSPLFMPYT